MMTHVVLCTGKVRKSDYGTFKQIYVTCVFLCRKEKSRQASKRRIILCQEISFRECFLLL